MMLHIRNYNRYESDPALHLDRKQRKREPLLCIKCDSEDREKQAWEAWKRIERVKGRFFNCRYAEENKNTWKYKPAKGQDDFTNSGYEWQLAKRFYSVGATDDEVIDAYLFWTWRNRKAMRPKFVNRIMVEAKAAATPAIEAWQAKQRKRRKHGTSRKQIKEAIQTGHAEPKEIEAATSLKGSTVRMTLRRMIEGGLLVKDGCRYAIAEATVPQVASETVERIQPSSATTMSGERESGETDAA